MTFDRNSGDFRSSSDASGVWGGIKRWSSDNPRLSRVVWIGLGLALLALVIWYFYPNPNQNRGRFGNNGPQPVGVAKAVDAPINVTLNALGTVTGSRLTPGASNDTVAPSSIASAICA